MTTSAFSRNTPAARSCCSARSYVHHRHRGAPRRYARSARRRSVPHGHRTRDVAPDIHQRRTHGHLGPVESAARIRPIPTIQNGAWPDYPEAGHLATGRRGRMPRTYAYLTEWGIFQTNAPIEWTSDSTCSGLTLIRRRSELYPSRPFRARAPPTSSIARRSSLYGHAPATHGDLVRRTRHAELPAGLLREGDEPFAGRPTRSH